MHDPTGGYQQPLYLSGPDHGMVRLLTDCWVTQVFI